MIRKDYLLRQFEEFGKVLAAVLTLKKKQNFEAFEQEMNGLILNYSHLDLKNIESLTLKEFKRNLVNIKSHSFIKKKIIASLLFEKMTYYTEVYNYTEAENLKEKCVLLLEYLQANQTENEYDLDIHYKLQHLKS